ncbi:septum formation initiator family protein, partial [Buchananella hordeovulneris]
MPDHIPGGPKRPRVPRSSGAGRRPSRPTPPTSSGARRPADSPPAATSPHPTPPPTPRKPPPSEAAPASAERQNRRSGLGRTKRAGRRPSGHPGSRRVGSRIFASKTSTVAAPSSIPARIRVPLFVLLCILILSIIINPVRGYLSQRHELATLQQKVEAAQLRNEKLRAELERWDNEDVVRREARTRLGFVAPGETVFVVLDSQTLGGLRPAP